MKFYLKLFLIFITLVQFSHASDSINTPIATDNRIKTYIYNENEVFNILVHSGYQSSIEFAYGEEVETVSMGDAYSWKITPLGRRLFIKPYEENIRTNMTIITNKRAYQFDIISKAPSENFDKELSYVVRFFYPELPKTTSKDGTQDE